VSEQSTPPAGWYPDPGGSESWRWWDGDTWTESLRPYQPPAPVAPAPDEVGAARRLLKLGIPLFTLAITLSAILRAFDTSSAAATWHTLVHTFRIAAQGGSTTAFPTLPTSPAIITTLSNFVVLPAQVVGIVLLLRFQHRSATTAKNLAIPARLSPTMGVVGWFLPFANFVMPLMAWHGLVSPGHPLRRRMDLFWALYVVSIVAELVAYPAAASSGLLASIVICAGLATALGAISLAPGVIEGVVEEHRAASGHREPGAL
jgi:Protein of unknown function (DUF2510)